MARRHPKRCRVCGKQSEPDDPISAQGYCAIDGLARLLDNNEQISERKGPYFEHWARRTIMSAHAALVALERQRG